MGRSEVPCLVRPEYLCECGNLKENVRQLNELGNSDRILRAELNRRGYDNVDPKLVVLLLTNPKHGAYHTDAFDGELYPYHEADIASARNYIIHERYRLLAHLETDPSIVICPVLQAIIDFNDWTITEMQVYLQTGDITNYY